MGQTLTHGVYLPDEGERNCYNGLAANWQLLDTSVGTIAANTAALAGKAPAVHTHTKSQITDFPAFGNAAGTICEGNDSRLSDARTPVAHTHLTSDVTDLLNSAHTWTGNQTYNKTIISNAGEILHSNNTNVALGEIPESDYQKSFLFKDKNNDNFGYFRHWYQTNGTSQFDILLRNKFANNAPDTSGSIDYTSFSLKLNADKSKEGILMGSFKPFNTNTYDLGTSTNKWKSLNGINPGALSLPDNSGYTNISGNITDLTGSVNSYTPPFDGYVMVNVNPNSNNYAYVSLERVTVRSSSETTSGKNAMATIPVIGGKSIDISVIGASIAQARFTPCLGNV